jgi:hypothetical protein
VKYNHQRRWSGVDAFGNPLRTRSLYSNLNTNGVAPNAFIIAASEISYEYCEMLRKADPIRLKSFSDDDSSRSAMASEYPKPALTRSLIVNQWMIRKKIL